MTHSKIVKLQTKPVGHPTTAGATISPFNLRRMAKSIASSYGDQGAVIITFGEEGYRFGVEGLSPEEVEKAACLLIHHNFLFSGDEG